MTDELLNTGSQPQPSNDVPAASTPEPSAPLNDAQLKEGMLGAINEGLGEPGKEDKPKTKEPAIEDALKPKLADDKTKTPEVDPKAKPKEEDIYKMPEGLQKDSQKRFQKLVEVSKDATTRATSAETALAEKESTISGFRQILDETKTSPEDLSGLLEYNRLVKTGDLEGAMQMIDEQRSILAKFMGRPLDGVDYLAGFDDLKQEVKENLITPERAAEIARARNVSITMKGHNERAEQEQKTQAERKQEVDKAIDSISKFAAKKSETDIDYGKKEEVLLKAIDSISSKFPPSLWLDQLELMYSAITVLPTPAPKAPAPLRPNAGGGGKAQARTMADAISQGLGYEHSN